MSRKRTAIRVDGLLILLLAYCAASLFHYAHNAEFLDEYPNMPAWLSSGRVYLAWLAGTAVGLAGYMLVRGGYRMAGLVVIAIYGALGFDGFVHYGLAPLSAHTFTMNLTIWLEALTALLVLIAVARSIMSRSRAG